MWKVYITLIQSS